MAVTKSELYWSLWARCDEQRLTRPGKKLADHGEAPLPKHTTNAAELETKVIANLKRMGFAWS